MFRKNYYLPLIGTKMILTQKNYTHLNRKHKILIYYTRKKRLTLLLCDKIHV